MERVAVAQVVLTVAITVVVAMAVDKAAVR